jgi:periplasmic protein TonB
MPAPQRTNGSAHAPLRVFAGVGGLTLHYDDPMSRVLELDASSSSTSRWLVYLLGAITLLLGLMVGARAASLLVAMTNRVLPPTIAVQEIEIAQEEPPPPPKAAEPEAKPEPAPPPPLPRAMPREQPPPTPPAQAAKVLTQEPDPNEPVDLTGNTIVSGNAESFPGGDTAGNGTGHVPGHGGPGPSPGIAAKEAPKAPPAGPNRSRSASVGATEWTCPFPPESDQAQVNEAYVSLEIDIRADGKPSAVRILKDPGNGFGREARRCALSRSYAPALDHDGTPISSTYPLNVQFSR